MAEVTRRSVLALALVAFAHSAFARNAEWAVPLGLPGVPNLNQVAPNLYRSAQPTADGFKAAESKLKLQTVIDLRNWHSDADLLKGTKLELQRVPMNALLITTNDVVTALKLIKAAQAKGAVLVHCQHGADRTGVVIAMYRIVYQGWSKQKAIDELENGGYNFHSIFANIPRFINAADVAAIKVAVGG